MTRKIICRVKLYTTILSIVLFPSIADAHVSEQGFVLLLPTGIYIISGTAAVLVSLVIVSLLPGKYTKHLFIPINLSRFPQANIALYSSITSTFILWILIAIGLYGARDPLENLLPLVVWTLGWQGILFAQAIFGNLWYGLNPWSGIFTLLMPNRISKGLFNLPKSIGILPAILGLVGFGYVSLVDIAPDDPYRLAVIVAAYWLYTMSAMLLFGSREWLARGEVFSVLLQKFALLSPFAIRNNFLYLGLPGWRIYQRHWLKKTLNASAGVFIVMVLALGSFDGLNETFWWLAKIGVNPLEFPGRSQVWLSNLAGLLGSLILVPLIFAICIILGIKLAKINPKTSIIFSLFALSVIPIAVSYHFSHYLTSFLVNIQYVVLAINDPLDRGNNLLNLKDLYVTSGFLNTPFTVQALWFSQAIAVVVGHICAVLVTHAFAIKITPNQTKAILLQLPLATFMIAYTLFGLWLLASPRGL